MSVNDVKAKSENSYGFSNLRTSDGKDWSFDVVRIGSNTGANANSVMLALVGCEDQPIILSSSNVTFLSVQRAGGPVQSLGLSFIETSANACAMAATPGYVRFADFEGNLKDGTVYTFTVTLNSVVQVTRATVGVKAGSECIQGGMAGPGCVIEEDLCGEGQGYFHKSAHWPEGMTEITIGGQTYTVAEAVILITSDKKEGGNDSKGGIADAKGAFAQGVTVLLNRELGWMSPNAYAAQLAVIETYLADLNVKLTLKNINELASNADAKAAASHIGDNIKCEEIVKQSIFKEDRWGY